MLLITFSPTVIHNKILSRKIETQVISTLWSEVVVNKWLVKLKKLFNCLIKFIHIYTMIIATEN